MPSIRILITGPSTEACEGLRAELVHEAGFDISLHVNAPGGTPLGLASQPDVLVMQLERGDESALEAMAATVQRTPTVVICPGDAMGLLRTAMRLGARDCLPIPVNHSDLVDAVKRLAGEQRVPVAPQAAYGPLIAVVNVKGGSGASFIASSLAHLSAVHQKQEVGLLDLDLQFGALPLLFDLQRRSSLLAALSAAAQIDETALRGYMSRHDSGVQVLSAMSEQLALPWEISRDTLLQLIQVMRRTFPLVVVDLPRQIDPLTTAVFEHADQVLMITQQSLAHTRDAKRMQQILLNVVGVPRNRLSLVINRYSERNIVRERDIRDAIDPARLLHLPNDFQTVSETLDIGIPVCARSPESEIAQALEALATEIGLLGATTATPRKRGIRALLGR